MNSRTLLTISLDPHLYWNRLKPSIPSPLSAQELSLSWHSSYLSLSLSHSSSPATQPLSYILTCHSASLSSPLYPLSTIHFSEKSLGLNPILSLAKLDRKLIFYWQTFLKGGRKNGNATLCLLRRHRHYWVMLTNCSLWKKCWTN